MTLRNDDGDLVLGTESYIFEMVEISETMILI
jgi:hypothetical protein